MTPSAPMREQDGVTVRRPRISGVTRRLTDNEHSSGDGFRFVVKTQGGVALLPLHEIDCLEADGNVVVVHTANGDRHRIREPLSNLFERLAPHGFIRVHRGTVVQASAITAVEKGRFRKAFVVLRGGAKFEIGRVEFQRLRALWQPGLLALGDLTSGLQLV